MTQPEALRLAEMQSIDAYTCRAATAAELRRLSKVEDECSDLAHQLNQSNERNGRIIAQRDALLEVLRALVQNEGLDPYSYLDKGIGTATAAGQRWLNARAAIKAVEENT